ncbi:MAG: TonB-dependent receptor [Saprospiraceae bacterium]|nr:TonB-dependent receptor [Saprospiraceae bacterium]
MPVRFLLVIALTNLINCILFSQISGTVYSESGERLSFATILIKGTTVGTTTDIHGEFAIDLRHEKKEIIASYIGYISDTLTWIKGKTLIFSLKSTSAFLDEVVVSGTMKEVSRMNSPVPIEVFTPVFFKRNPSPNLFTALENINGVRPQLNCNVCNTGDIHINGMEGPYTMVLIDGMPIVSSLSTVYGLMGIPNSIVQRIEVVKGPASTLYGSEAVGGLINVITKNPETSGRLTLDINSTSYQDVNIDLGTRIKVGKSIGILSANIFHFDKIWDVNHDNFTDVTLQKRVSLFNKWNFKRTESRKASLAIRYVWEDRWGGELQWTPEFRGGDSLYGESIKTNRIELIGNYQFPLKEKINLAYSYNFHDQNSVYGTTWYIAKQQIGFTQLTWDKSLKNHDFLTGLAFRYIYYDDNTPVTASAENNNINKPVKTYLPGIFIQDEISFGVKHKLLAGFRYDYNSDHGNIFTPRLNYQWTPTKDNTFRIGFGNGFRVANVFSEDHAALTGAREVVIKDNLNPEKSYNFNINQTSRFYPNFGFLTLDGSIFYTYFSNRIVADFFTDPNKIIYNNLNGYSISKGVTLNSEFNFVNGFKIMLGGTLMDVYLKEENPLDNAMIKTRQIQTPYITGNWTMSYTINKMDLTLDYTGTITSPMGLPVVPNDFRSEYSPWFSIQNVQITKKFNKEFEIYFGLKNLLNFRPEDPILRPFDPFDKKINVDNPYGYTFDPTYNYAALQGFRCFLGVRAELK